MSVWKFTRKLKLVSIFPWKGQLVATHYPYWEGKGVFRHSCFCLQYTYSCFPACSLEITVHFVREQPDILQASVPTFYKRGCEQD